MSRNAEENIRKPHIKDVTYNMRDAVRRAIVESGSIYDAIKTESGELPKSSIALSPVSFTAQKVFDATRPDVAFADTLEELVPRVTQAIKQSYPEQLKTASIPDNDIIQLSKSMIDAAAWEAAFHGFEFQDREDKEKYPPYTQDAGKQIISLAKDIIGEDENSKAGETISTLHRSENNLPKGKDKKRG